MAWVYFVKDTSKPFNPPITNMSFQSCSKEPLAGPFHEEKGANYYVVQYVHDSEGDAYQEEKRFEVVPRPVN